MRTVKYTIALLAAAFMASAAYAQSASVPLDVNPDPVSLGMANTGTVLEATPYSMWNNPAGAVLSDNTMQVGALYSLWNASGKKVGTPGPNNVIAVAGYGKLGERMTISAGFKYFGHQSMFLMDASGNQSEFTPLDMQVGVGLGFKVLPILSLGANVSYVLSDIGGTQKGNAVSADFGALLDLRFIRVGLTASNIGSQISYGGPSYCLPTNAKLGVGTVQSFKDVHELSANVEAGMTFSSSSLFAGVGVKYEYNNLFHISAGYHYGDVETQYFGSYAAVGAGFQLRGIALNLAYLIGLDAESPLTNSLSVGLSYAF